MKIVEKRDWFTKAREEKGYSKSDLAKKIKVVKSYITAIENGEKNPSGKVALKLSIVLGINMEKFYENEIEPKEREELLLVK